jgi:tripartite-type tricarboxylate transporter receptor subunit TctC
MKELVEYSKKHPGEVTFACPGAGGASHIGAESLTKKEGIKWRMVPYKGSIDATAALMGSHVDLVVSDFVPWQELVRAGKLRILALEEEPRQAYFPNAQGFNELGYTVTVGGEFGVMAPKGTPPMVMKTLHDAFKAAMETENFKNACKKVGVFPVYRSGKDLESHMRQQYVEVGKILKDLGMDKKSSEGEVKAK